MRKPHSVLQELDDAIMRGSTASRTRALWHATDLLIAGNYSEDQIWTFGEVIGRLAEEIELNARAELSRRLGAIERAPIAVINKLAHDDSIDVAEPVLRQSPGLNTQTLVKIASSKSQQHLLAISQRKSVVEAVTDVLVTRGDQKVVHSIAANPGACFSDYGFLHLIKRSQNDSILTEILGTRTDIPRHLFQQLIAKASETARLKLGAEHPEIARQVDVVVTDVTGSLHAKFGPASNGYFVAKKAVTTQHQRGGLGETQLHAYALAHKINEVLIALSLLSGLRADVVERALDIHNREMLLVVARALELSWTTTMALLFLGAPEHIISAGDLEDLKIEFERLDAAASKDILQLYRARKESAAAGSGPRRLPQLHST